MKLGYYLRRYISVSFIIRLSLRIIYLFLINLKPGSNVNLMLSDMSELVYPTRPVLGNLVFIAKFSVCTDFPKTFLYSKRFTYKIVQISVLIFFA